MKIRLAVAAALMVSIGLLVSPGGGVVPTSAQHEGVEPGLSGSPALDTGVAESGGYAYANTVVSYPSGWNLVSAPAGTTFSAARGLLYTYQGSGAYTAVPGTQGVTEGWAYWAYFPSGANVTLNGAGSSSYSVSLGARQLKMVGNPSGTKSARIVADYVYTYSPSTGYRLYRDSDVASVVIPPGMGVWAGSYYGNTVTVTAQ